MAVHTPVSIQQARVLRKKKCLIDDRIVISNKYESMSYNLSGFLFWTYS